MFSFQNQKDTSARAKVNFMDLNIDCMLIIFDHLNMDELITFSQVSNRLYPYVERILRQKVSGTKIEFNIPYDKSIKVKGPSDYVKFYYRNTQFQHFPTIINFLKHFPHLILRLSVRHDYTLTKAEREQIYDLINLHCSETLNELSVAGFAYSRFTKPFPKVEVVSVGGSHDDHLSLNFTTLFPSIRRLNIGLFYDQKLHLADQKMPTLEEILISENDNGHNARLLEKIIRNNSQIKSLILHQPRPNLLEYIATELPHLERLSIIRFEEDSSRNYNLNFQHLKYFSATMAVFPLNIVFDELEEIEIRTDKWESMLAVEKVIQYKRHLKTFELNVELNDDDITRLANGHLDVIEMKFFCGLNVTVGKIVELVEKSERVQKLRLSFGWSRLLNSTIPDELQENLPIGWRVTNDGHFVFLNRL